MSWRDSLLIVGLGIVLIFNGRDSLGFFEFRFTFSLFSEGSRSTLLAIWSRGLFVDWTGLDGFEGFGRTLRLF